MNQVIFVITFVYFCNAVTLERIPKQVNEWREVQFAFPTPTDKEYAIANDLYVPGNAIAIDVDVQYAQNGASRIFITVPRFSTGVPITLGTIKETRDGPKLSAYPAYNWHSSHGRDCNGFTSVFRIAIDPCERLWVIDTGMIGSTQFCSPRLMIFDLRTDTLLHRYVFPDGQFRIGTSLLITPIIDVEDPPPGRCRQAKAYIGDVTGFGILVYDALTNKSWRIQNRLLYPTPQYGIITIAGESFDLMDGVMGMSVTPRQLQQNTDRPRNQLNPNHNRSQQHQQQRYLYFHSMASIEENIVPLSIVSNETLWQNNFEASPRSFTILGSRGTQSVAEAMDSNGNLYFGMMDPIAIGCWNINTPYNRKNINVIIQNDTTLQFASGIKVIRNKQGDEELWFSTNRLQKIMAGTKSSDEINFRIQAIKIYDLLSGQTNCNMAQF